VSKRKPFDPPQTWYEVCEYNNAIRPIPNVVRATAKRIFTLDPDDGLGEIMRKRFRGGGRHYHGADPDTIECAFPTLQDAERALLQRLQSYVEGRQKEFNHARQALDGAKAALAAARAGQYRLIEEAS
jgi:hypothetical protein